LKLFVLLVRLIPLHLLADQSSETTTATWMSMCLSACLAQTIRQELVCSTWYGHGQRRSCWLNITSK
jgi:hypothetical protein